MNQIMIKKIAVSAFFCLGFAIIAICQTAPINIVTTAVPFLRISPDARAGGMGDCGIALSPDANAGFWNLAKTPFSQTNNSVGLTYTPWLRDIAQDVYMATLSGFHKLDDNQALSASLRYFNLGSIQFVDNNGNNLNTGRPREFALDFGYSTKISGKFAAGAALRYINSDLANGQSFNGVTYKAGTTASGDLSVFYNGVNDQGQGVTWGISLSNLGGKIGYTNDANDKDFIPANLGIGAAYTWAFDETSKFTLGTEVNKLLVPSLPAATGNTTTDTYNLTQYHNLSVFQSWFKSFKNDAYTGSLGGEYSYNNQFFARAGYFYEPKDQGDRQFFSAGLGLKYESLTLNFSYLAPAGNGVTRNPLSNTLRFGVIFDIDAASSDNNPSSE
jgi:hypothetical protein